MGILPAFADHAAGQFFSGVTGGLGAEIVWLAVDHHGVSNNFLHRKPIRFHRQVCPALTRQQRRQVTCVFGMRLPGGSIVASCLGKVSPGAAFSLMDVEPEESGFTFSRQAKDPRHDPHTSVLLIKLNASTQLRPSRLVHYEGVFHNRAFDAISDVESRMYASPADIRAYLESHPEKPFLLCEYMHDMGNSLGGMESYIRLEEEFAQYQGGFIWDYMDQALWHRDASGRRVLGYGGDFEDRQSDYAFSGNGIVFADGREKPAMQEVRYWYAPKAVREQWDRENLRRAEAVQPLPAAPGLLKSVHGDGALGVFGEDFEILFSYPEGGPVSLVSGAKQWLWRAPRPAYWRAPTENDLGNGFAAGSSLWAAVDGWQVCSGIQVLADTPQQVSIRYCYTAPAMPGLQTEVTYTVADGWLHTEVAYRGGEGRPQLPLLGLRFATPEPVEQVQWLGLSGETYPDRKKGGCFGWHQEVPQIPDYLRPQESGCHVDTHQTILCSGDCRLVVEKGARPYAFSAIPYTPQQLSQAYHKSELPQPCRTVVTICGAMRGVGGIDSWGADVESPFQIPSNQDCTFSFRIRL